MIFLDTDICIDILNGKQQFKNLIDTLNTAQFGIAAPSIFELYHGLYKLKYLKKEIAPQKFEKLIQDLNAFINRLNIFPLNETSAELSAKIHMQLKGEGKEIDIFFLSEFQDLLWLSLIEMKLNQINKKSLSD